jgi:hypothetical protein
VTNKAYRIVEATNAANGTINVTSNSGTITVKSASASAGTLKINAYNNASTPAFTGDV